MARADTRGAGALAWRLPRVYGSHAKSRRAEVERRLAADGDGDDGGIRNEKTQVLDGPYADAKEQLGGFHIIEVPDLDEALAWAARSPTALHGAVEVRPMYEGTFLTEGIEPYLKRE